MSDLLEDQKIAYIVKDYRRMFNIHSELVDAIKEATKALKHKDNRIRDLEKQVANLQSKIKNSMSTEKSALVRSKAILARDQVNSLEARITKAWGMLEDLITAIDSEMETEELNVFNDEELDAATLTKKEDDN